MSEEDRIEILKKSALAAMEKSYSPYSNFAVGAALICEKGDIHTGCNIENASYPCANCAEACAVGGMVISGSRKIVAAAVTSSGDDPPTPCGRCRQILMEFAADSAEIICFTRKKTQIYKLKDLLPHNFKL